MPLPDAAFDVALCQMSLQFMADTAGALREMLRVLEPGGRLLVSLPRPNPLFEALDDALVRHVGQEAGRFVRTVFSMGRPDQLRDLLRDAGFQVREDRKSLRLPPAQELLWQYAHSTPLTALLAGVDDAARSALEEDVVERWRPWSEGGWVRYEQSMIVGAVR